jgi:peptidylprolyl isomerase
MRFLFCALLIAGCSASHHSPADAAAPADLAGGPGYYAPAGYTLTPFLSPDAQHSFGAAGNALQPNTDYLAVIETDVGRIVIDLLEKDTPITVNSFVWLALHHFFDGIAFHRVIDGFMAQTGDPNTLSADMTNWGIGGPGYSFGLEIVATLKYDAPGVVGMARATNPNTNGSQFFITFAPQPTLDGQYTIFAKQTEGADVLPKIVRGEPPAMPTRMQRVYIVQKP